MGLDLWFRQDVARIMAATWETMQATRGAVASPDDRIARAYERGFEDALRALGVAFGLRMAASSSGSAGCIPGRASTVESRPFAGAEDLEAG